MKRISVYLSHRQIERLNDHAERTGLTKSDLIRRAIDDYLDRLDEKQREATEASSQR